MTRHDQLLRAAAAYLEKQRPLDDDFRQEYGLEAEEQQLFVVIAQILRGYLRLPASRRTEVTMLGDGAPLQLAREKAHQLRMEEIIEEVFQARSLPPN